MNKTVEIFVDGSSWPGSVAPAEIAGLASLSPRTTNVGLALIHSALWTRPPLSFGFHLADLWAWLRYLPAISNSPDLRLREEWTDIDPHQKTVMSDELGVGFATELLVEALDILFFVDTKYVINVLQPGYLQLGRNARRKPRKSPDYLAVHRGLQLSVIECKGTQSSTQALERAALAGSARKEDLTGTGGPTFKYALVAGLFIPTWANPENALIHIRDPESDKLLDLLSQFSDTELLAATMQIALAKHFSLMGMHSLANALSLTGIRNRPLPELPEAELMSFHQGKNGESLERRISYPVPQVQKGPETGRSGHIAFTMRCPRDLYSALTGTNRIQSEFIRIAESARERKWEFRGEGGFTALRSPLGFEMELEYDLERG